jgi:flavin reductase (DIM6/NTAB) family NADH-FMN oxidoreductase RutF
MARSPAKAAPRPFSSTQFRAALGTFATGVTIVTARDAAGLPVGITANSFASVSLDPPLVLWSLGNAANSLPIFSGNSHYVINVLSAEQAHLAQRFSKRSENPFEGVDYVLSRTGQPILTGVSAWFECHNRSRYPEGDHVIFVGEVEECAFDPQASLIFHAGQFGSTQTR